MLNWVLIYCWGSLTNCWEVTCDGQASHPRGVEILLAASCYRNGDKLGLLWASRLQGFTFWVGTFRWPPVHGLPHMDYQMDYPNGLSNGLPRWTTHMDYLTNYPRKRKERNITPSLLVLIDSPPIRHLVFISITAAQIICRRIYCRI